MTGRQRLALAAAASLLLHAALVAVPGWRLPRLSDLFAHATQPEHGPRLAARLMPPRHSVPPVPVPAVRPTPQRRLPRSGPTMSTRAVSARGVLALPAPVEPQLALSDSSTGEIPLFTPRTTSAPASVPTSAPAPTPTVGEPLRAAVQEIALPRSGSIRFAVSRGEGFAIGQSVHRWTHDGGIYSLSSQTETTGIVGFFRPVRVIWKSSGTLDATGLRPEEFRVEKDGVAGDSARFDWGTMLLTLSAGAQREVALVAGAQDMLSLFYQLGMLLQAAPPGQPLAHSEIMVATGRKFERYGFDLVGEETLMLKSVRQRVLHLRTSAGAEATEVWLAPDLRGLPLKIRIVDRKGERFDQVAETVDFDGMSGAAGHR